MKEWYRAPINAKTTLPCAVLGQPRGIDLLLYVLAIVYWKCTHALQSGVESLLNAEGILLIHLLTTSLCDEGSAPSACTNFVGNFLKRRGLVVPD